MLPQLLELAGEAEAPQALAELAKGELAVAVCVQASSPRRRHGTELAQAQIFELLGRVDLVLLDVRTAGFLELVPVGGLPGFPDLEEETGLLALVEGHLQGLLAIRRPLLLAEHPEVAPAVRQVRLAVEVLQGQVDLLLAGFDDVEQRPGILGEASTHAGLHELILVDQASALSVEDLHPGQQQVSVHLLELRVQLVQLRVDFGVQVREHQEPGALVQVLFVHTLAELLPQALHIAEKTQALQGDAKLAVSQPAVAVEVEARPPRAEQGAATDGEGLLEALDGVQPGLERLKLLQLVLLLLPGQLDLLAPELPGAPVHAALGVPGHVLGQVLNVRDHILQELLVGLQCQALVIPRHVARVRVRVEVQKRHAETFGTTSEHAEEPLGVQLGEAQVLQRRHDLLLLDTPRAVGIDALLPSGQHVPVLLHELELEGADVVPHFLVDLHE
mmetsp:Transcript_102338/g.328159  ORF Transcript_102338/g.328159 Transcript_102338/m.328159 type:complete len:446 (-) Transcript_102338:587-1924(-)